MVVLLSVSMDLFAFIYSLGARSVLYAFRGQEGLTTVFSQLKGAEQDALGGVIVNTSEHCQINGFLENGCR